MLPPLLPREPRGLEDVLPTLMSGPSDLGGSNLLRFLFPSFEKPDARRRYLNVEPESHDFRGVGTVLLLAASCGVALALWEPSHQVTTPFATASASRSVTASVGASKLAAPETTAAADAEDDQSTPTVKLSTLCSQRATARRDCASAKAVKDARLTAPDPVPASASARASASVPVSAAERVPASATARVSPSIPASAAERVSASAPAPLREAPPAAVAAKATSAEPVATAVQAESPNVQPPRTASVPKPKRPRPVEEAPASLKEVPPAVVAAVFAATANVPKSKRPRPVEEAPAERLVKVYDQVMPDGRRIPVYRRVGSGSLEIGTIVDGDRANRPARRANLEPPTGRYFGLQ
jgi:hypothetical protein